MEPQALEGPQPLNAVRAVIDEYPLIVRSRNVPTQIGLVGDAGFDRILARIVVENCSPVIGQGESGIRGQFLGIKNFVELVRIERRVQDCNGPAGQVGTAALARGPPNCRAIQWTVCLIAWPSRGKVICPCFTL